MKQALFTLFVLLFMMSSLLAQSRKKKGTTFFAATTVNYYPALAPYTFERTYEVEDRNIILNYISSNSGKFIIEEGETLTVVEQTIINWPSQLYGIGASVQAIQGNGITHELSLTKLSFSKSSYVQNFSYTDSLGNVQSFSAGVEENSSAFAFRYEIGKYFGDPKYAKVRFGLTGGIESSFYSYNRKPLVFNEFPVEGRLVTLQLSLIPVVSAKLSKVITLDVKAIPNFLIADFGQLNLTRPDLPKSQQQFSRDYDLPEMDLAFSILLRYKFKEPKRRRRTED
jgi:hypothetical protein